MSEHGPLRAYWAFYWPLALAGLVLVLSVQFQNAILARYPDAVTELAVLAIAYSIYGFFHANLGFVAQLSNVYARSSHGTRTTWRFVVVASFVIALPVLAIGLTEAGARLVQSAFSIERDIVERVAVYLVLMCPLIILGAQRHFYTGLIVQAKLTGWLTVLNAVSVTAVIVTLIAGFASGFAAVHVIVGASVLGDVAFLSGALLVKLRAYALPEQEEHATVSYVELLKFFIPVSATGVMFALSRPVLYAFVARTEGGLLAIAALRVGFDFSMLFQQSANQFRHFFITFGFDDLQRKKIFMALVCLGLTAIMLIFVTTPLSTLLWIEAMGLSTELTARALEVTLVMCLMPAVILWRNFYHGRLMTQRRTTGMAVGAILRVVAIYALAYVCFEAGALDHITATLVLVFGFVVETLIAQWFSARIRVGALSDSR